ncbi:MAG: hypothetical protein J7521_15855 [Caulobacter sp.]|nr:hypothetical protein [Caulobacter sp.]
MNQIDASAWNQALQLQLMAALDAAWAVIDASQDPEEIRQARERVRLCGEFAATARKVALMIPRKPERPGLSAGLPASETPDLPAIAAQAIQARRALERLKAGKRGRL